MNETPMSAPTNNQASNTTSSSQRLDNWRFVWVPVFLLTLAIAGISIFAYDSAKKAIKLNVAADMEAIAKLKTSQIEDWLDARREDAELISTLQLSLDLQQWINAGERDDQLKKNLLAQLRFPGTTKYREIGLHSSLDGRPLLASGKHPDTPEIRAQALNSARHGIPLIEDIHAAEAENTSGLDVGFFNPLHTADGQQVLAVMHLTLDPGQTLFALLQKWPLASRSAETLLLRQDGDNVLLLNTLRQLDASAGPLHRPLATGILGARLLKEGEQFFEADDYRGVPVLGYGRPIASTPWFLVVKVDQAEAYAQLDLAARITALLFVALLLLCAWWLFARKQAALALQKSFQEIDDLYQNAPCGYHSLDENGTFVRINDTELALLGYRRDEVLGKLRFTDLLAPASLATAAENFPRLKASGQVKDVQFELTRKDGTRLPVMLNATAITDENGRFLKTRSTVNDITERKQAEHVQQRLGRALRLLSDCSMALVCASEEQALLDSICRLIVETGGYQMAAIGIPENNAEKTVRIVSHFGDQSGYLDGIRISWADTDLGRGPSGTAIRLGLTQINQDFMNNPAMAPWRDNARKRGYQSSIALPLINLDVVSGVLTLYSSEANAFGPEEVKLLEEFASNLTFGIQSLRLRNAHVQVKRNLKLANERLRVLFNSIRDALFVHGVEIDGQLGCFVEVNDVACERLGYSRAELLAMSPQDIDAPEYHVDLPAIVDQLATNNSAVFEQMHVTKDGRRIPVEISSSTFTLHGKTMIVSLARDITESRIAKQQLIESASELHKLSSYLETVREEERAYIARELHDELGQMLTALKMDISSLRNDTLTVETGVLKKLGSMTAMVDETLDAVRRIASDLRPIMLDELGLKAALEWLSEEFENRYCGINCTLVVALDGQGIKGKIATAAYRIVQECMTNVVRHAQASKIHIAVGIDQQQQLFISVQDNGCGLPEQHASKSRFGVVGMRERAHALGGSFDLESIPGDGVSINVTIPLPTSKARSATQ